MKKNVFLIVLIIIFYIFVSNIIEKNNLLPEDAIRIRIIANSNSKQDQSIKYEVKEKIEKNLYPKLYGLKNREKFKNTILNNMNNIDKSVKSVLNKYNQMYKINYGMNYFPEKYYRGNIYRAGYYESLVITIGNGEGDNYWCVLYPTICMIEVEESDNVIYTTLLNEIMSNK